jgi:hypothetical protein
MNKTKHFRQIFEYLFGWIIKPVAMTKILPFKNPLASRFHWTIRSGKILIRLIFPVEI